MCCAVNPNEPLGICGGWIDYDRGFNKLVCLKCGAEYKAVELAKDEENNKIIRKGRKTKMKVSVNYNGKKNAKEINLDGQLGSGAFKPATAIVRPTSESEAIGKLKVKVAPVAPKVVKEVAITEEKVEVVEKVPEVVEETPVVEEEKVEIETPVIPDVTEEVKKSVEAFEEQHNKASKKGMKVKVTNQDGTTTEKAVNKHKEETHKNSGVKVNNRHYKHNDSSDMPRRSQIQLTAITFEQLKELDFKYSSTDLEFHKMFFRAEHEKSNPSVMVDFDSIPKEKLELILGVDFSEAEDLKEELEKTKADLNATEEALMNLRKLGTDNSELVSKLQDTNNQLVEQLREKDAEIARLKEALEDKSEHKAAPATEYDTEDIAFVSGTLCSVDLISQFVECPVPENAPSKNIIAIETEDGYVKDQDGKVICIGWMNNVPLNQLWVNGVEIDAISFGTYDDPEEEQVVYGEGEVPETSEE